MQSSTLTVAVQKEKVGAIAKEAIKGLIRKAYYEVKFPDEASLEKGWMLLREFNLLLRNTGRDNLFHTNNYFGKNNASYVITQEARQVLELEGVPFKIIRRQKDNLAHTHGIEGIYTGYMGSNSDKTPMKSSDIAKINLSSIEADKKEQAKLAATKQ